MQLTEGGIRATGTNAGGFSLYRVLSVLKIDAGAPVGRGQDHPLDAGAGRDRNRPNPQPAGLLPTPQRRTPTNRKSPKSFCSNSARRATNWRWWKPATSPKVRRRAPDQPRMARISCATRAGKWFLPPEKPHQDPGPPSSTIWKTTAIPSVRIACTLTTTARAATVAGQGAPWPSAPPNRSPNTQKKKKKKKKALSPARGATSSSGPSSRPFPDFVQLRVGRGALHACGASSGAHIATASSMLEVRPQPGVLGRRRRAGSPASGCGPGRRPRSGSW